MSARFRVAITGSRSLQDKKEVISAFLELLRRACLNKENIVMLNGMCSTGVDKILYDWAIGNKVKVREFPADWNKHGKKAGYLRNIAMVDKAHLVIALWDGESNGTKQCFEYAIKNKMDVFVYRKDDSRYYDFKRTF